MKSKFIILLISAALSSQAFAKTTFDNIRLMQLYLDKNQLEKVEDLYDEEEATLSKSWMALERLAISFERREKLKEAVEVYRKIITSFNQEAHQKVVNLPENKLDSSVYDKTKLSLYYYKLAFLNAQLFSKTNDYTPASERGRYKKNAEGFIGLSRKVKVDEADLKVLQDQLQEKIIRDDNLAYKTGWYASIDLVSWQDRLYLVDQNTAVKTKLLGTAVGSCIGGGKKWENIRYEFNFEGCFAVATASISSESTTVRYQQSSVSVKGFMAGPGMYFKTISDNVLLGVQLPVKYRQGDWTNPDESLYRLEREKTFEAGFFLQSKIKIKKVALRTRLGKVFPNPGSLWSVGLLYDF